MAKSLEEIKAALESQDGGDELYEGVVSLIEQERAKGVSSSKKLKNDISTYSKYKSAIEKLGYDGTDDVDTFVESLSGKIKAGGDDSEIAKLRRELTKESKARQDFETKLSEEKERSTRRVLLDRVVKGLQDDNGNSRVYGADLLANDLIGQGRVKLVDNDVVFVDGDDEVSFDDGINKVLQTRKDLVRNTQKPGAGSTPSGEHGKKTIARKEFDNLPPSDKMQTVKEGITITD